ncbi:MAG: hypothetical protein V4678_01760 [Patescibacteria group bacterium]
MSNERNVRPTVSHADYAFAQSLNASHGAYLEQSRENLTRLFPRLAEKSTQAQTNDALSRLALGLADVSTLANSRRNSHYSRYRLSVGIPAHETVLDRYDNLAESSLLDLRERTKSMSEADYQRALGYGLKGVSAELGHADQLGDIEVGGELDDMIRELPYSDTLAAAGLQFDDTYDAKEQAKISYKFQSGANRFGPYMFARRMRAAADVRTEDGAEFDIVKISDFYVDHEFVSRQHKRAFSSIREVAGDDNATKLMKDRMQDQMNELGHEIIEPAISEKMLRQRRTGVLAVTSLYFALHRHR